MSVYIKGFSLPNNCGACPLRLAWCRERIYMVTRPERCPLVPVPEHGRLIDADAMEKECCHGCKNEFHKYENCIDCVLANAPTIIPAEEGE